MLLNKRLSGTVGEDIRSQNPSNHLDQEKMNQTENVTQGTKKLQDEQRGSCKSTRTPDYEFCEPARKAKQKLSGQRQSVPENKSKITEANKLPDVLLQLLRPDAAKEGLLPDSDPTQQQLPDASSPRGFAVTTYMSLVLESLFYSLYREDEEQEDICLSVAHSQKMESDMRGVLMKQQQETKAEKMNKTSTPRKQSPERAATHSAEPRSLLQTPQRQQVGLLVDQSTTEPQWQNSAQHDFSFKSGATDATSHWIESDADLTGRREEEQKCARFTS